jgi:L-ascorbate metabolism protein UlaG (beta-lactamase superfamily)
MQIRWFGQSAFLFTGAEGRVFVDPFGHGMAERAQAGNTTWSYAEIEGVDADLLLVTHDHMDHNGVDAVGGEPAVIRAAGTHDTPIGEVVGIASEHDDVAGTTRGPNTIFRFALDGITVAHFGDFGQPALRPEQRAALGDVDVVLFPIGGGPTTPAAAGAALLHELAPRLLVPMHYRSNRIGFLDPPEPYLEAIGWPVDEVAATETEVSLGDAPSVLKLTFT